MREVDHNLDIEAVKSEVTIAIQKYRKAIHFMRSLSQQFDMRAMPHLVAEERMAYFREMGEELRKLSEDTIEGPGGSLVKLFPDGSSHMSHSIRLDEGSGVDPEGTVRGMFFHLEIGSQIGCFVADPGESKARINGLSMQEKQELLQNFDTRHQSKYFSTGESRSMDDYFAFITEAEGQFSLDTLIPSSNPRI